MTPLPTRRPPEMAADTTYKPRAGSSAEAAIHHLAAHGPMLATELADAIELDIPGSIHGGLKAAVNAGAVETWSVDGRTWYGLPGAPRVRTESAGAEVQTLLTSWGKTARDVTMADVAEQTFEGRDSQHVLKAEAARPDATDRENAPASPVGGPMGAGQAAAAAPAGRQRIPTQSAQTLFALWSDGRLQIEREGSDSLVLSTDDTRALVAYLERMAEVSA